MKTLRYISAIGLGIILMYFVPDKEKKNIQTENQNLKKSIESLQKDEVQAESSRDPGVTVLPKNTKSITLKGFVGSIRWYQSPNLENLADGSPADFHAIEEPIQVRGGNQTIELPPGANAILRKNMSGAYQMQISTF